MDELVLLEVSPEARRHPLPGGGTIGREATDVVLDDERASRRHASIVIEAGAARIEDLGSRNGTFVNGKRISAPAPLADGDEIRIGHTVLRVELPVTATVIDEHAAPHPGPEPPRESAQVEPEPVPPEPVPVEPAPVEREPAVPPVSAGGEQRGDVPRPQPVPSAVRRIPPPDPARAPSFSAAVPPARRRSAARSDTATFVSFAIVAATAIAVVVYFGLR